MAITFYEEKGIFKLDTRSASYIIALVDQNQFVGHVYYGKKLRQEDVRYLMRIDEPPFVPSTNNRDRASFMDAFPMEYPGSGTGDYREGAIEVRTKSGHSAVEFKYDSHKIYPGKPKLEGLPATFGDEDTCTTLELVVKDEALKLSATLYYTTFEDVDVIARSVKVKNEGEEEIYLTKVLSAALDMDDEEFELVTLHGSWARERHIEQRRVGYGKQGLSSNRGESSHQDHPFLGLKAKGATQERGDVYGFHFVYSGNFFGQVEKSQFDSVRVMLGINPEHFCWKLNPNDEFQAPEVICVYSSKGLDGMTHSLHDLYRNHLIRSKYKDQKRPILINNWEATYFDFDTEKLLSIAKRASELGIEMLVMDDGWFGDRNDDSTSLGDWQVNEKKITGGLKHLVDEVNKMGMKFGIWFEPEMISPDSKLYKEHPDWAIAVPNREGTRARNQFVLDLSRKEVVDYVYECVASVLRSANIEYVKWDMNRQLSDLGSAVLPADQQGELSHRYVLAVYELQERLTSEFPNLLLENCSGGGARFDPGMLYYSPQIWCSDDTDAIERLKIQEGTAMLYPLSTMGAHISDCPNHTVGRVTPFETRGYVALAGTFGYELDITKIPQKDQEMIPDQVAMYHKYNDLVRSGDYYRVASYQENHYYDCYGVVSKDKNEALFTFVQVLNRPNFHSRRIRLKGLDPEKNYRLEGTDQIYAGDILMYAGMNIANPWGDFKGQLIHLTAVDEK
ncbi:MAG: alpha-galactosidase [Lachnospiraceae bacterium]